MVRLLSSSIRPDAGYPLKSKSKITDGVGWETFLLDKFCRIGKVPKVFQVLWEKV